MDALEPLRGDGVAIALGVNTDDLGDHRPGQRAAGERAAVFPLVEAGFSKADVRDWSQRLGLRTWDKPAAACLASRLPYGTEVTVAVLSKVERAEAGLRALGFRSVRVRHYERTARVEVPVPDLAAVLEQRDGRGRRGAGGRLRVRHARSRRPAFRQPERRASHGLIGPTTPPRVVRDGSRGDRSRPARRTAARTLARRVERDAGIRRRAGAGGRAGGSGRPGAARSSAARGRPPARSPDSMALASRRVRMGRARLRSASTRTRPLGSTTTDSPAVKIRRARPAARCSTARRVSSQPGSPSTTMTARATSRSAVSPNAVQCS